MASFPWLDDFYTQLVEQGRAGADDDAILVSPVIAKEMFPEGYIEIAGKRLPVLTDEHVMVQDYGDGSLASHLYILSFCSMPRELTIIERFLHWMGHLLNCKRLSYLVFD